MKNENIGKHSFCETASPFFWEKRVRKRNWQKKILDILASDTRVKNVVIDIG